MPNTMSDAVMSVVITGRRMQASEMFMSGLCPQDLALQDSALPPRMETLVPFCS